MKGKRDDARAMYEKAVELSEWNQLALNNLAHHRFLANDFKGAEELYIRLLGLDGRFLLSYYMLAKSQIRLGHFETAYQNLRQLDNLINDGATLMMPRNKGPWFWHGSDNKRIYLYSEAEKQVYARYLMGLAAHLAGTDESEIELQLSDDLAAGDTLAVQQLIAMDLADLAKDEELQASWPDLKKTLSRFSSLTGGE